MLDCHFCIQFTVLLPLFLTATAGKVRIVCDTEGKIARAAGLVLDATHLIGRPVIKRFCALVEDGVIR